jgi:hypothetical protein
MLSNKAPEFPMSNKSKTSGNENDLGSPANDSPVLKVEAAAIRSRNGDIVTLPPPCRHHDIARLMWSQRKERPRLTAEEFLLPDGTWCDRRRAAEIAIAAGQVHKFRPRENELTTPELW